MGLFSSKKKTYVSSVTYPMGEDDEDRTDFLQYTVLNATLQGRPVGESITQGYLRGQGMSLRNAFRYARDEYAGGVPYSATRFFESPDRTALTAVLQPRHPGSTIQYLTTVVGTADYEWFAEQYLTREFGYDRTLKEFVSPPKGVDADAAVAYDMEKSGLIRILLMNADGATQVIEFRPTGYTPFATFVHCCYQAVRTFIQDDSTTTRPAEPNEVDSVSVQLTIVDLVGERQERTVRTEIDVEAGVATVRVKKTVRVISRPQYFLYQLGLGTYPTLDAWRQDEDLVAPFYPAIPIRIDNQDWASDAKREQPLYKTGKKLLKKVGVDLDKVADDVNANKDIGEIDFCFVTFGVALNTKSQEGKRYVFRFLDMLRNLGTTAGSGSTGGTPGSGGTTTETQQTATKAEWTAWASAFTAGQTTEAPKVNTLEVYARKNRNQNHDIKLQWDYIDTQLKSGQVFPGAKPGDVDISMSGTRTEFNFRVEMVIDSSKLYARRQIDEDTYVELEVSGLVHENFVYAGKSVSVTAYEAFHDRDEEGFILPLSQEIVRQTPLVELTNLSYQCTHLVFNCYRVVKQKWYQTGLFKILLVVIAVVLMIFFPPAGITMMASYIGAAIGVSLLIAKLIAIGITMLASMLLSRLLTPVFIKVFGEQWGAILAVIATALIMGGVSSSLSGTGFINGLSSTASGLTSLTAANLINGSMALLNAYGISTQAKLMALQKEMAGLQTEFDAQMEEIERLTKANLDTNMDLIDIEGFTQATRLQFEASDVFLGRTLMTGGDIAEITNGLITDFAEFGLRLPTTG